MRSLLTDRVAAAVALAALSLAAAACSDDDAPDADTEAWCRQFDVAISLSVALFEQNPDENDPEFADEIAALDAQYRQLREMDTPSPIRDDFELAILPGRSSEDLTETPTAEESDAARKRLGQWVLDNCEVSEVTDTVLREDLAS